MSRRITYTIDSQQCLSLDVMKAYLERELGGRNMHQVEKHLLECEICANVMDDFSVSEIDTVKKISERVNRRVTGMVGSGPKVSFFAKNKFLVGGAGALMVGTAAFFMWPSENQPSEIVQGESNEVIFPKDETKEIEAPEKIPEEKSPAQSVTAETMSESEDEFPVSAERVNETVVPPVEKMNPVESKDLNPGFSEENVKTGRKEIVPGDKKEENSAPVTDNSPLHVVNVEILNRMSAPEKRSSSRDGFKNGQVKKSKSRNSEGILMLNEMPQFFGGDAELKAYITKSFKNPLKDKSSLSNKTTYVLFLVDSRGRVSDVELNKSISPEVDKEIKRVFDEMPDWSPGKKKGTIQVAIAVTLK